MRKFEKIGRIKVFINDPNKKSFFKIIKEVFVLYKTKKEIPYYYFKYLYRKDVKNYLDYLSAGEVSAILSSPLLHKPAYKSLIENKLFFALLSEKSPLNTPKLISYNLGTTFYHNNTIKQIYNRSDLVSFFDYVFTVDNLDGLFFRRPSDYGGKGCFKLTKSGLKDEIDTIFDSLIDGYYIHTKIIKQHREINKINDKSVNTLRIISLITSDNHPEIISAFMRFGVGNSIVDNASSGGFFVGVNMDEGTLKKNGHYMPEYGGKLINKHPDSGFKIEGFKIPYFK
ncbi:MAG: sugar-transfer associated ATP-grasp domain-containing protein, partial [Arenibacter latericius]|nr:sugar-transfer associated ATP-grasp domain-containing protein [Arenibacter latericius]